MKDYWVKFKYIFPVYLYIYIGMVVGLYALRYFFAIKFQIIDIDENIWELWIPMILSGILVFFFLQPRLKILIFSNVNGDKNYAILFFAWLFILASTMNSQQYLMDSTGSLVKVEDYDSIKSDTIRFVTFNKPFFLNKNKMGFSANLSVSGNRNEDFNYDFYYAIPFAKSNVTNTQEVANVWYCISFHKIINNREDEVYKKEVYETFYKECINRLNTTNFENIAYFERMGKSSTYKNSLKAINSVIPGTINKEKKDLPILLKPVNDKFEERVGNLIPWFFLFLISGLLTIALLLLWPSYNKKKHENILKGKKSKDDDFYSFLKILIPKGDHFIVSIILNIMIVLYFIQLIQFNSGFMSHSKILLNWGALRDYEVANGEFWRLLTSMFSHGSFIHLLYNGIALVFVGVFVEPLLGRIKFTIYYLISGIAASLASIVWNDNLISIGASGAIFGLFGLAIFIGYFKTKSFNLNKYLIYLFVGFVGINFIYGFMIPNIDNAGHLGGFITGIILAYLNVIVDQEDEFAVKR